MPDLAARQAIAKATQAFEQDIPEAESDSTRPVCHFRPPAGYHNDPNGLIQHKGIYHLFYQFHPFSHGRGKGGEIFWGHARSRDLIHWEHLPIAIWPSPPKRANNAAPRAQPSSAPTAGPSSSTPRSMTAYRKRMRPISGRPLAMRI